MIDPAPHTVRAQGWRWQQALRAPAAFALLVLLVAIGTTLALYGRALGLPLFFDDMIHLRWLDWHSLPSVWATAEGLGYYRPLTMSVWKVGHMLWGHYDPRLFHLINLFLHALNGVLAGYLGWRASKKAGRPAYALLTMLVFLTFPFSYQAVPSSSSLSKPLIATLVLGSVALYWDGRRKHSTWRLILSLLAAFSAPFAYETGVMVPLAILSTEAYGYFRREFERFSRLPALFMLLVWGVALPLIVRSMPATGASFHFPSLRSLWQNGVYFLEGLLFPITWVATSLERIVPLDRYWILTIVGCLGLAALLAFYLWAKQIKLFLYATSWFLVAVLPLWLALDFSYVITSPRLLYLGAVGAALLWAGVPVFLWTSSAPARWWFKVLAVVSALVVLAFSGAYVRDKMALAETMAAPLWQAARAAQVEGNGASLLYVNVPAWIAPKEPTYRVGTEGLTFIPEYVRVQDFVYVNTGAEPEITAAMFDPAKRDWQAYVGYAGEELGWTALAEQIRQAGGVYVTTYGPAGLRFVKAGSLERPAGMPADDGVIAHFGDQISLHGAQAERSGQELLLALAWYGERMPENDVTVFVHVYDDTGQLIAQGDGYPLSGLFPPWAWQQGDLVRDVRRVVLPEEMPTGHYAVAVGWYDTATGQRLPVTDRQGQPLPQDAVQIFAFNHP